jgi:hypothetical protein
MRRPGILTLVVTLALTLAGCHERGGPLRPLPARLPGASFIALERDFQDFRRWERIAVPERAPAQSVSHTAGRRSEYVNGRPPAGSRTFPVGTILVKEIETGAPEEHKIFAMAKRGGGYNARGAKGWEWFELKDRRDGSLAISWRGLNAPDGESYGGDPAGGCNACHDIANDNDYVQAEAAALEQLALR